MSGQPPADDGGTPVRGVVVAVALVGLAVVVFLVLVLTSGVLEG